MQDFYHQHQELVLQVPGTPMKGPEHSNLTLIRRGKMLKVSESEGST